MEPETKNQRSAATITINGKLYDARTGQPLHTTTLAPLAKTRQYGSFDIKPAGSVHAAPAKSQTLRRTGLVKPQPAKPLASRHVRTISPIATHPSVTRFGRPADTLINGAHIVKPSSILSALNAAETDERPVGYATQVQNYSPASSVAKPLHKPAKPRSHAVTEHQLSNIPTRAEREKALAVTSKTVNSTWKKFQRRIRLSPPLIVTGIILALIVASVIAYLTVPTLSLFVAAKSANVEATYPNYVPAGYHFNGPVTYGEGMVKTAFVSSGTGESFTIVQKNTTWDSGAVLDNYVLAKSPNYLTYSQSGITVYTFGSQAAWVNSGVLHTIEGDAKLTSEQILRLASSM